MSSDVEMKKKWLPTCLLILVACLFFPALGKGFTLVPDAIKVKLPAGAIASKTIEIYNDSSQELVLSLAPEIWNGEAPALALERWLQISPKQIRLKPFDRHRVQLRLKMPDTLHGELVVMLFFISGKPAANIDVNVRVGVPVYICRSGTEIRKAEVISFRLLQAGRQKLKFAIQLANQGNIHLVPFGTILITRNSKVVCQQEVRFSKPLFSKQEEQVEVDVTSQTLGSGQYLAELSLFLDTLYPEKPARAFNALAKQCWVTVYP